MLIVKVDVDADSKTFGIMEELSEVDDFPEWAQKGYQRGRIAIKATQSKLVVCCGGDGVLGAEAEASFDDGVKWVIFACSRGQKEHHYSLLDWAAEHLDSDSADDNVEFVRGIDPN